MVLIFSHPGDQSTCKVIDWLHYFNTPFQRVNGNDLLSPHSTTKIGINKNGTTLQLNAATNSVSTNAVWFRRDGLNHLPAKYLSEIKKEKYHPVIVNYLNAENWTGKQALYSCAAQNKRVLGSYSSNRLNKIEILLIAAKCSLEIPDTIVTNSKKDVVLFSKKHKAIITKSLGSGFSYDNDKNQAFQGYTEEITGQVMKTIPQRFFYSLFQEKLDKEIDIRVFYLDGKCYSMAIFSQMEQQTATDFRKYSKNRMVPYKLPVVIADRICNLMDTLGLNTGSIDIIKTKDGRMVFLEVNPVGQYDMTSVPCNYQLDKKIAEYLILKTTHDK